MGALVSRNAEMARFTLTRDSFTFGINSSGDLHKFVNDSSSSSLYRNTIHSSDLIAFINDSLFTDTVCFTMLLLMFIPDCSGMFFEDSSHMTVLVTLEKLNDVAVDFSKKSILNKLTHYTLRQKQKQKQKG